MTKTALKRQQETNTREEASRQDIKMADLLERELGQTLVTSLLSSAAVVCHQGA